jgi:type II secretory pathway pseudopilin PulG
LSVSARETDRSFFAAPKRAVVVLVLAGIMLLAAAAKAWQPWPFVHVVAHLLGTNAGSGTTWIIVIGVVAWETFLGLVLLCGASHRGALWATVCTLLGLTAVLAVLLSDPRSPSCGCFGFFSGDGRNDLWVGLVRNGAMLWMSGWLLTESRASIPGRDLPPSSRESPKNARAFTVIEVLVVLSVIVLVISLALPALARVRQRSREARTLSMLRQLAAGLSLYTADHKETFPYFGTPGDPLAPIVIGGATLPTSEGYFRDQSWHWASVIVPAYCDAPRSAIEPQGMGQALRDAGYPEHIIRSYYILTYTAFAAPEYWVEPPPDAIGPALLRATRQSDLLFPSRKGLLLDSSLGVVADAQSQRAEAKGYSALADGSARTFDWHSLDWTNVVSPPLVPGPLPVMSTRNGLRGIDF